MTQLERDIFRARREKFSTWIGDTYTLYDMAELGSEGAINCILSICADTLAHILAFSTESEVNRILGEIHVQSTQIRAKEVKSK